MIYFNSKSEFQRLDPISQRNRRAIIEACLLEPLTPGGTDLMADCPISRINSSHIKMLRDRRADKPGAANNRKKYLGALFSWAVEAGHMTGNPARDARPIRYATEGFHTWTIEEVRQFEASHPIGTKARLAMALMLFLGVRRSDVVVLGRQMVKGNLISMVPRKNRHRKLDASVKPILPALAEIIAASPCGDLTYLTSIAGQPFKTAASFGNWFRNRCNEAGLPQCAAHGLRKAGAVAAAEAGATDRQMMALFDWQSSNQATTYTKKANKQRMAVEAARLMSAKFNETAEQTVDTDCRTLPDSIVAPSKNLN